MLVSRFYYISLTKKHSLLLLEKKSFYEISFHQFIVRLKFKLKLWFYSYSTWIHFPAPVDILSSCQRLISIVRFFGPMIGQLSPCRSLIGRHWLVNVTLFSATNHNESKRIVETAQLGTNDPNLEINGCWKFGHQNKLEKRKGKSIKICSFSG